MLYLKNAVVRDIMLKESGYFKYDTYSVLISPTINLFNERQMKVSVITGSITTDRVFSFPYPEKVFFIDSLRYKEILKVEEFKENYGYDI